MFTKEQVLAKVRKLIALATNDGATEHERERAMEQAHKFCAKHNLSLAMAEEAGGEVGEKRVGEVNEFVSVPWSRQIAAAMARMYFCNYSYYKGSKRHLFIGKETNVVTAQEMNNFVRHSAFKEAARYGRANGSKRFERAFMEGVADTISQRVTEILVATANQTPDGDSGTGTSLVLASVYENESKANTEFMEKMFGKAKTGKTRRRTNVDTGAYLKGVEKGKSINLNTQLGANAAAPKRTRIAN